jgi:hypothetical protein
VSHRHPIKRFLLRFLSALACVFTVLAASGSPKREFLTEKEIELIQDNYEIHIRVKRYLDFAASRLKVAEERLSGKESEPGDPFEFFTPEDMLAGYYRILESVMLNLEDAYKKTDPMEQRKVQGALKTLKEAMERALKQLEILKTIAEEKNKEELWNLVNKAIDISKGAHEGAESGISKEPDPTDKKTKRPQLH